MAIATYEYTTLRKIIALAKTRLMPLGLTTDTTWDIFLKGCAIEAAREMMTELDFYEYTASLDIVDFVAVLPQNFVIFDRPEPLVFTINGQVGSVNTTDDPYSNQLSVMYIGNSFVVNSPFSGNVTAGLQPTINVQDGKIYFSNNISFTQCTISYLGVLIDENGEMKIPMMNERVIMYFIIAEWKRANGIAWQVDQQLWSQGKKDRRGKANLPDSFEKAAAAINWNRLI